MWYIARDSLTSSIKYSKPTNNFCNLSEIFQTHEKNKVSEKKKLKKRSKPTFSSNQKNDIVLVLNGYVTKLLCSIDVLFKLDHERVGFLEEWQLQLSVV